MARLKRQAAGQDVERRSVYVLSRKVAVFAPQIGGGTPKAAFSEAGFAKAGCKQPLPLRYSMSLQEHMASQRILGLPLERIRPRSIHFP